jgi:beta-lactamase superfamily II metal-dependent hydrolase
VKKLKLLLLSILILIFTIGSALAQDLKIYCIDVDQGMSTLIVTPNGKSVLIDCGGRGKQDAVYDVITQKAGLTAVDYFVLTHYHEDHYGSIKRLKEKGFSVREKYYDRNQESYLPDSKKEGPRYEEYVEAAGDKRTYLKTGRKINLKTGRMINIDSSVDIECIVVNGRAKGQRGLIRYPEDENAYSIGLMISYNGFDFLIAGDITEEVEHNLVKRGVLKNIDVYHVSHHGSDTSSCTNFLKVITPEVCIISNGSHGTYKHPRRATVERLEKTSSVQHIYQTNKNIKWDRYPGTVKNTPDEFIGDLDSDGDEGTILIEVKDNTYVVKILTRGIEKVYRIER